MLYLNLKQAGKIMGSYLMITGARGGLGGALITDCARRGYDLYLTDRDEVGPDFCASIANTYGVEAHYLACDLTSREARTDFLNTLVEQNIHFWGLINVAGRDYEGPFTSLSREQVLNLTSLIIEANLDLTHAVLTLHDPQRRFMLINIGSLAAFFPMPYKGIYSSSKRFLLQFSLALRQEIKDFGSVTILCASGMPTNAESKRKISAQGFWGKISMQDPQMVAHRTIDQALKGKAIYIPGILNQVLAGLGSTIPLGLVTSYIANRWKLVHQKLDDNPQAGDKQV
jgi:uncharacterized protein